VAGRPYRGRNLLKNCSVIILAVDAAAADTRESVSLAGEVVERGLVSGGDESVAGLPRATVRAHPDCGVVGLTAGLVAADVDHPEALRGELIEAGLMIGAGHAVIGVPGGTVVLLPDSRVARLAAVLVTADVDQAITLAGPGVEFGRY
jgi:hypothetical protein